MFSIIVAMSKNNRVIGKDNKLPRYNPEDLKYFKEKTKNKTIIMGRKTFESIGKVLPKRENVILTRDQDYQKMGIVVLHSPQEVIDNYSDGHNQHKNHFIIGGAEIYQQFLDLGIVKRLYITEIYKDYEGDTIFPEFKHIYKEINRTKNKGFDFVVYEKKFV